MKVIKRTQLNKIATVFIAENDKGRPVEFVESVQPPHSFEDKWVVIISTLYGCPVDCSFCDAGGNYAGKLTPEEMFFQIDHAISHKFPGGKVGTKKFKIQFSRMGEPSFNPAVLDVLNELTSRYKVPELIPSLSSIAPLGTDPFFDRLVRIKKEHFRNEFQMQFSLHSTETWQRDRLIPVRKHDLSQIAAYGKEFYDPGGRKITLNFALTEDSIIDEKVLRRHFHPDIFLIKITPMNPTFKASKNNLRSLLTQEKEDHPVIGRVKDAGYEVIVSIGEWEENAIGSNCGQYVETYLKECRKLENGYAPVIENL